MRVKDNTISFTGVHPAMMFALYVADEVYRSKGTDMVITSVNDGAHSYSSLHYAGCAVDLRIWNLPEHVVAADVATEIKERVGYDFDVIVESDHIHMEYQPKKR